MAHLKSPNTGPSVRNASADMGVRYYLAATVDRKKKNTWRRGAPAPVMVTIVVQLNPNGQTGF